MRHDASFWIDNRLYGMRASPISRSSCGFKNCTGRYHLVEAAWEFVIYIEVLVANVCSKFCIVANVLPLCATIRMYEGRQ